MERACDMYLAMSQEERKALDLKAIATVGCGYCNASPGESCTLTTAPLKNFCHKGRELRYLAAEIELGDLL